MFWEIVISLAVGFIGGQALAYYDTNLVDKVVDFFRSAENKVKKVL